MSSGHKNDNTKQNRSILFAAVRGIIVCIACISLLASTAIAAPLGQGASVAAATADDGETPSNDEQEQPEDQDAQPAVISIEGAVVSGIEDRTYTGKPIEFDITVTLNGKVLTKNIDYKVVFTNNTLPGRGILVITGKGDYTGEIKKTFKIDFPVEQRGVWKLDENGWWYSYDKEAQTLRGKAYPSNEWAFIEGKKYHFDNAGYMQTGWLRDGGVWYLLGSDGAMKTGWALDKGTWYRLDDTTGAMKTGWLEEGDVWYYLYGSGAMATGWAKLSDVWFYFLGSGAMATGWQKVGNIWYFLDETDGYMKTGWLKKDGAWYYLYGSGAMATGWINTGGVWYYLYGSGAMATDWLWDDGFWYYLYPDSGAMATGYVTINDKQWHFEPGGRYTPTAGLAAQTASVDGLGSGWYVSTNWASLPQETVDKLNNDMMAIWRTGHDVGFVLIDLETGATIAGNPSKTFYAASSIKGPYVCAIACENPGKVAGYRSTVLNVTQWSSNDDYKALRSAFGAGPMQAHMNRTNVHSISAGSTWVSMAPRDLAKLWAGNYDYFINGNSVSGWVREGFKHSAMSYIDGAMGRSKRVYSKAGWIWDGGIYYVYDDGGIVSDGNRPYVLAIMSSCNTAQTGLLQNLVRDLDAAHDQLR